MAESRVFAWRLGQLIRRHRLDQGRIQADVATAIGVSLSSYSEYERGQTIPSVPVLLALIGELEITAEEFLALSNEPNGKAA